MMSVIGLSQNTKTKDSVTISVRALDLMIKDIRKCDSVRVALLKKDTLIFELTENNLQMFSDFSIEREKKKQAIEARNEAQRKLDKFDRKRFSLGISVGPGMYVANDKIAFGSNIALTLHYSLFRF